ncbi:MAG TPA: hypothetical protein VFD89_03790 [Clostridia bacterium]|nr:hypothetical protein [Clostridia bacterium]
MYNDDMYSVRYATDPIYNQEAGYDYYGGASEPYYPYPTPCPEYPSTPPMPPVHPMPPGPPMPPTMPMHPVDPWSAMKILCLTHLKNMLEKMKDKKVALIIEGARGNFDCVRIMSVDECKVVAETKNGVCVISLREITAVCMTKEVADQILKDKK